MVGPELGLASLHHLHLQLLSLLPPALIPVRRREVVHARQRRGMVGPELGLASLHHLHKQLLSLLPSSFVVVYATKRRSHKTLMPSPVLIFRSILADIWKMHH